MTFVYIVEMMIVGFVIASGYIYYNKILLGSFVRTLLSEGCLSMQSAKTLSELGFMALDHKEGNKHIYKVSLSCS